MARVVADDARPVFIESVGAAACDEAACTARRHTINLGGKRDVGKDAGRDLDDVGRRRRRWVPGADDWSEQSVAEMEHLVLRKWSRIERMREGVDGVDEWAQGTRGAGHGG